MSYYNNNFIPTSIIGVNPEYNIFEPVYNIFENPNAIHILEQNLDNFDWSYQVPNFIHILFPLNLKVMKEKIREFREELVAFVYHPIRLSRIATVYNMDLVEYINCLE